MCGREMKSWYEGEGESVGERGREYGRGGRVRMVVEEGECMGKGGSFKGRGRKYEREKGKEMRRLCEREGESVRERERERERIWEGGRVCGGRVRMVVGEGESMGEGGVLNGEGESMKWR